jgi:hypothetical protein
MKTARDLADAIVKLAEALPPAAPLTRRERIRKRAVARRASPMLIELVLAMVEANGGRVMGMNLGMMRGEQERAERMRVAVNGARAILNCLIDEAITLDHTVAQCALSTVGSLAALSRTEQGKHLKGKVKELRAAAKKKAARPSSRGRGKRRRASK